LRLHANVGSDERPYVVTGFDRLDTDNSNRSVEADAVKGIEEERREQRGIGRAAERGKQPALSSP
jgi:hypothetical protein